MTTDRHACGLSSFLPMSCRGRAEAFARRLQSRLQSLGRQPSDEPNDSEESWLTTSQHYPTSHQPRLSTSSDSDIYFDFDVDFGSPGSPQEEATEDDHPGINLNRRRECDCIPENHDLESGCATSTATASATSPGSDSSDSNNYYDPEADFTKTALHEDLSALIDSTLQESCSHVQCNGYEEGCGTCFDCSSTMMDNVNTQEEEKADTDMSMVCKVNDCVESQSNESKESPTCTPEHEGTTNETSNETKNDTLKTSCLSMGIDEMDNAGLGHFCTRVRKPRVDYTKCNGVRHENVTEKHEVKVETQEAKENTHEEITETHEVKAETHEEHEDTKEPTTIETEVEVKNSTEVHEVEVEKVEAETDIGDEVRKEVEEVEAAEVPVYTSEVVISDENLFCSTLSVSSHELLVECPTATDECPTAAVESHVPDVEITVAPEEIKEASPKLEETSSSLHVDDTDDEERPQRVRRCSSLKTGKTPPGTPGRKKIVRFADVLGLDLADVRTFLDEVPKVPTSAYEDLHGADLSLGNSSMGSLVAAMNASMPKPDKTLVPLFVQPGGNADFFDRVREQQVCLENAIVSDVMLLTISGTVRVRNLDFNKSVHIRYSVDGWVTFSDLQASYVQNSCDGFSDTFSFVMYAHTLTVGQRLEFAVRFQCHGCQYWDSNRGSNYVFQCLPPAGSQAFRSHPMSTCPDEQWASFY